VIFVPTVEVDLPLIGRVDAADAVGPMIGQGIFPNRALLPPRAGHFGRHENKDTRMEWCATDRDAATLSTVPGQFGAASHQQVRSLTLRNRFVEAIGLGIESLRELGITIPAADRRVVELDHQFDHLYRWLDHTEAADDRARPDITEPTLLTAARLLSAVGPAGGLVPRGESADAAGEAVPSTGTPTTRWRFSSLMSATRSRPPLSRLPNITTVSPRRTASASRANPARRLWCPHGTQRSDGVARRAPDGG
jgi:hypothetical protein